MSWWFSHKDGGLVYQCQVLTLCTTESPLPCSIFTRKLSRPILVQAPEHSIKPDFSPPFNQSASSLGSKQVPPWRRGAGAHWFGAAFRTHTPFLTTCSDTSFAGRDGAGRCSRPTTENHLILNSKTSKNARNKGKINTMPRVGEGLERCVF